jgi:serine/threonine protein kinase
MLEQVRLSPSGSPGTATPSSSGGGGGGGHHPFCRTVADWPIPIPYLHASLSTVIFGCLQIVTSFVVLLFLYCVSYAYTRDNSRGSFAASRDSHAADGLLGGNHASSSYRTSRRSSNASSATAAASLESGSRRGSSGSTKSSSRRQSQQRRFLESVMPQGQSRSSLLVLPVYRWALWGLALTDLMQGVANVIIKLKTPGGNLLSTSLIFGFAWGSYHFVLEGIAFLLMQQGCGRFALRRTLCFATFWGLLVFAAQTFSFYGAPDTGLQFLTGFVWDVGLFMFYTILWLFPAGGLPCAPIVRPALVRIYAPFWSVFHLISSVSLLLEYTGFDVGVCIELIGVLLPFAVVKPFVVYFTLRADSRFWMGLGTQTDPLQQPLLGSHLPADSARELAQQLDTSVTRGVRMLEPALLKIEVRTSGGASGAGGASGTGRRSSGLKNSIVGIGGSARVYAARYRGRRCAAKLLFLPEITASTIRALCNEASLLSGVQSPHVMKILGICVRPPSIFLVSEIVSYGSLFDIIHVQGPARRRRIAEAGALRRAAVEAAAVEGVLAGESKIGSMGARAARTKPASSKAAAHQDTGFIKTFPVTGEFSLALRMHLALGCAEAVQSLHAQSPPVVHGDIKSQNFLLHDDFLVKVADLELASRCLQGGRDVFSNNPYSGGIGGGDAAGGMMSTPARAAERSAFMQRANGINKLRRLSQSLTPSDPDYTIPEVANWLAPEVLDGHTQSPRSDVYSLAMTLFEVFTDSVPFSHLKLSSKFEGDALKHYICTEGVRPIAPREHPLPPPIEDLLARMWHTDRSLRPDAASVVRSLRGIAGRLLFGELSVLHHGDELNSLAIGARVEAAGLCACVLDSRPPFRVQYATHKWQDACGWPLDSIVDKTLFETLKGPLTNASRMASFKQALALGDFHFSGNVHYSETGKPFLHLISVSPLTSSAYMTPGHMRKTSRSAARMFTPQSLGSSSRFFMDNRLRNHLNRNRAAQTAPRPGKISRVMTIGAVRRTPPASTMSSPASSPKRGAMEASSPPSSLLRDTGLAYPSSVMRTPGSGSGAARAATPPPLSGLGSGSPSGRPGGYESIFRSTPDNNNLMRTPTKPQLPKFLVRSKVVRLD